MPLFFFNLSDRAAPIHEGMHLPNAEFARAEGLRMFREALRLRADRGELAESDFGVALEIIDERSQLVASISCREAIRLFLH